MALKGTLLYKKSNCGCNDPGVALSDDVKLTVYGYDSIAKLALHFCYEGNDYMKELDMLKFFDTVYDKALTTCEFSQENIGDRWRRIDISQGDKLATNFQNRKAATIIAASYRYAMTHSVRRGSEQLELGDKKFSNSFVYDSYDADGNVIATFARTNGVLTSLYIKTPLIELDMEEDTEKNSDVVDANGQYIRPDGNQMFAKFQVKDKYQNILSRTPIKNIAFKYTSDILGFPFIIAEKADEGDVIVGMYSTMEEVIDAHPDKNFAWIKNRKYRIVTDEDLQETLQGYYDYDGIIAVDTETSGLDINFKSRTGEGDQLVGICLSKEEGTGDFIPLKMKHIKNVCEGNDWFFMTRYMKKFLETHRFVTHNLSFDWKVFYIYGIDLNAVFDTMLAYSCTERYKYINFPTGLKELTKNIFDRDMIELSDFVYGMDWSKSGVKFWDLTYEQCRQYAPTDADSTLCLYNHVVGSKLVESFGAERILEIELKFAKVIGYSEFWGYHLAIDELPKLVEDIENGMKTSKEAMIAIAGEEFNPDSPKQLGHVMYDILKMPDLHKDRSTNKTTLKELSEIDNLPHSEFIQHLMDYRRDSGVYKSFIKRKNEFISEDGYIFPHVYSFGTDTGRCSIKEPNYQSYNDVVKKRVIPRGGFKMFDCDFSQIEYRVLCSMASEENLKQAFLDPDMDYHTYQAARMFDVPYGAVTSNLRKQAKGINFGLPYGMGDRSLGLRIFGQATKENTTKAAKLRARYFEGQENIEQWFQVTRDNAVANGYSRTIFGRSRFYFTEVFSEAKIRRQAGNHAIQGSAADIYKIACNRLFDAIVQKGWLDKVLLNAFIHDEVLGEVSDSINPFEFIEVWRAAFEVPIEGFCKLYAGFGFGRSWYEAKKQDLTPPFIEEIVNSPERDTWNKSSDEFVEWIYANRYDYELRRIIDYFNDTSVQGEVIKPIIEAYLREKLNDCPEEIVAKAMNAEDVTPFKKMKGGKFKEWDLKLNDAITVFCCWMNETRQEGILDRSKINILSATDIDLAKPKVEHVFDINKTNMTDIEFIKEYVNNMGYYVDYEGKAAYIRVALLQAHNKVDEFISKFCISLEEDELEDNTLPNIILVDNGTFYPSKFYLRSSMFMVLQGYMLNLNRQGVNV